LLEQFAAESFRRTLQFAATPVDDISQRENHIGCNIRPRTLDDGKQNRQIVIVAKEVRHFPGNGRRRFHLDRPEGLEQFELVAKILRSLSPFMQMFIGWSLLRDSHGSLTLGVGISQARHQDIPCAV
jgi:hypothetical protein